MKKRFVRLVLRRRVFVIFLLLVQIVFFISLIGGTSIYIRYVNWLLRVLSIIVSIRLLNKHEKAGYKFIWLFLMMVIPIFGGIMYLFFNYMSNPRKLRKAIERITESSREYFFFPGNRLPELVDAEPEFKTQASYLQNYAGFPVYSHTRPSGSPGAHRSVAISAVFNNRQAEHGAAYRV